MYTLLKSLSIYCEQSPNNWTMPAFTRIDSGHAGVRCRIIR
jgi:hypothetical protein